MELNVYGFVGLIMLVGIVKKNAIMMIDVASRPSAAARRRPRPSTRAACSVPADHDDDDGRAAGDAADRARHRRRRGRARPLGLAVVGGLLVSQMLTLYITPVLYLYMESARSICRRVRSRGCSSGAASVTPRPGPLRARRCRPELTASAVPARRGRRSAQAQAANLVGRQLRRDRAPSTLAAFPVARSNASAAGAASVHVTRVGALRVLYANR
jgi:hypothetical protein